MLTIVDIIAVSASISFLLNYTNSKYPKHVKCKI